MAKRAMTEAAKAEKAKLFMDKAVELYETVEFDRLKMSDITKALGMSAGSIYVYFKTKETLFLSILMRELDNRVSALRKMVIEHPIENYSDLKTLVFEELDTFLEEESLLVKLLSITTVILERNVEIDQIIEFKKALFSGMQEVAELICTSSGFTQQQIIDLFQTQTSVIVGVKNQSGLSPELKRELEAQGLCIFKSNFKKNVYDIMGNYMDGYFMKPSGGFDGKSREET